MQVTIDLKGLKTKEEVLHTFGEVFQLGGGPEGNIPVAANTTGKGWGMNWDALADSMSYLDTGGMWGTSRKFEFPLTITVVNVQDFQENDSRGFSTLEEILDATKEQYAKKNKILKVNLS
jgi:hypothetical protein